MPLKLPNWPGRTSISQRLTLFFALTSTLVLLALGYLIAHAVERHFIEQDLDILSGKRALVERALARIQSADDLPDLARSLDDARAGFPGLVLAVVIDAQHVVFAGQGGDFPGDLLAKESGDLLRMHQWTAAGGRPWRGMAATIPVCPVTAPGCDGVRIALALDITHHEHFMNGFRLTLWTFVSLAALLCGVLGHLVVRRGLRPLHAIRQQTEGVTAQRLDARLSPEAFPAELAELVIALNAMLARLEKAFVRLSEFSSDLAHEFRTPISNLMLQAEVTLSRARTQEEYRDVLASSMEEYERLSQMIADMLFIAQAEEGRIVPDRQVLDFVTLGEELLDYYRLLAEERAIDVTLTGRASAHGDRAMMRRALSNLLSNALRHTPPAGRVSIELGEEEGWATLCVSNTGSGIAEAHLPHLFDRFYRVEASRQRDGSRTGLGLAIVKSIVEAHGGRVEVASDAQLTRFTLYLPQSPDPADYPAEPQRTALRG